MCFSVEIVTDLNAVAKEFNAKIDKMSFGRLNGLVQLNPKIFKLPKEDNRIYPNFFAPILLEKEEKVILAMRYRIRPKGSKAEVSSIYNLFNARLDSLLNKPTWVRLLNNPRGVIFFKKFFEWVNVKGKKRLASFTPEGIDYMWAPCLTDQYESLDGAILFNSFAIITDQASFDAGHDRWPLFLKKSLIEEWISTKPLNQKKMLEILAQKEEIGFSVSLL